MTSVTGRVGNDWAETAAAKKQAMSPLVIRRIFFNIM
jgi:hypothetical protein